MTLCIGGPLHGRQAPLEHEDRPHFNAEGAIVGDTVHVVTYRRRPIDIFVGGTSVPAYVYATDKLNGREVAARIAAVLGNAGRQA